jgi:transcriptional regulator with XRE-family HTH domain
MTTSSTSRQNYRPGTSRKRGSTATFRRQMSDFARGSRIRELRAAANLTREHLAHELGTTTKSVYAWENNGGIRKSSAEAIAEFFGVPVDDIRVREEQLRDLVDNGPPQDRLERIERVLLEIRDLLVAVTAPAEARDEWLAEVRAEIRRQESTPRNGHGDPEDPPTDVPHAGGA